MRPAPMNFSLGSAFFALSTKNKSLCFDNRLNVWAISFCAKYLVLFSDWFISFAACPPFQIDGNFGTAAGIVEMLLQSHERYFQGDGKIPNFVIELLPALPYEWGKGHIEGIKARGGFELSIFWNNGKLTKFIIKNTTQKNNMCRLRYGGSEISLELDAGEIRTLTSDIFKTM